MAIESWGTRAPMGKRRSCLPPPAGRSRLLVWRQRSRGHGRWAVAAVLVLLTLVSLLGGMLGFSSQAFDGVEMGAIVLVLVLVFQLGPTRRKATMVDGKAVEGDAQDAHDRYAAP